MTAETVPSAPAVNLGLEASVSGFELVIVAAIFGICLYYLYRTYFGSGGTKCGGCSQKKSCGVASAKRQE